MYRKKLQIHNSAEFIANIDVALQVDGQRIIISTDLQNQNIFQEP